MIDHALYHGATRDVSPIYFTCLLHTSTPFDDQVESIRHNVKRPNSLERLKKRVLSRRICRECTDIVRFGVFGSRENYLLPAAFTVMHMHSHACAALSAKSGNTVIELILN